MCHNGLTPGKQTVDSQSACNTEHLHQSTQKIHSFHQHPAKWRQLKIIQKNSNGKTSFLYKHKNEQKRRTVSARWPEDFQERSFKPATHLAILYADRGDRRIKSPISGMSDIGDKIRRHSPSVPAPAIFYGHCCESPVKPTHQVGRFTTWLFKTATSPRSAKKIAKCVRINRWQKSLAIFAGYQIRRDRRIKSPGVSLVLVMLTCKVLRNTAPGFLMNGNRMKWKGLKISTVVIFTKITARLSEDRHTTSLKLLSYRVDNDLFK